VNHELQQGSVLQERFVLGECLLAGTSSQLWSARDTHLDAQLLLRIYLASSLVSKGVIEGIKRDARHYRRLRHPDIAPIHDVHEGDGLLIVSIEAREGRLLSAVTTSDKPMPYRDLITASRPLVEALLELHESGGEHGRLDSDHVIVTPDGRWVLLPGDMTRPSRSDMQQLGRLIAARLTGGQADDERPLNDRAELLYKGRTVPALLDHLVGDLRAEDSALRPSSMRDVLHRLDQLEEYVEGESIETSETVVPLRPSSLAPTTTVSPSRIAWVLAAALLIVVVVALLIMARPAAETDTASPEIVEAAAEPALQEPAEPTPDPARLAAEKATADQALDTYLGVRRAVDDIGAADWGGEPYALAVDAAAGADEAYLAKRYVDAAQQYAQTTRALQGILDAQDQALAMLLSQGAVALAAFDAVSAEASFQHALRIDPASEQAKVGLRRAGTLEALARLLETGAAHENDDQLALAEVDYASAVQLDPDSPEAAAAYERIKDLLANDEFQSMMSAGLSAFHDGDMDAAREHLLEAQRFRSGPEVEQALAMVQEARLRIEVERLWALALVHEQSEQWQAAWTAYRQVLAIDATILLAQLGKARSETMLRLDTQMSHYLKNSDLLIQKGTREAARRLVQELERTSDMGPRMQRASEELAAKVRLANTPMRVVIRSDNQTAVDVYQVGRYGTFKEIVLELLPGNYTLVGYRKGYKDVRLTLELKPGETHAVVEVVCTESI
jgi:hypothetical protein